MIRVKYIETPVGILSVIASENAIIRISFVKYETIAEIDTPLLNEAAHQIELYFAGELKQFTLPLAADGTEFQNAAWAELRKIPYGKTASYSEQAKKLGRPKAVRAVGGANNKNPLAIIVPCHRVVGKNGSLTGFAGGLKAKQFLLAHEAKYS